MTDYDEAGLARGLLAILDATATHRLRLEEEAAQRGITLNQLVAAAMAAQIVEQLRQRDEPAD